MAAQHVRKGGRVARLQGVGDLLVLGHRMREVCGTDMTEFRVLERSTAVRGEIAGLGAVSVDSPA